MWISELWRYPVKSMAGERLASAELLEDGIRGDRVALVADARGRVVTSRSRPQLLAHKGTYRADGEPLIDGRLWTDESVAGDVRRAGGEKARLVRYDGVDRFDILPLLVATDGAITAFGYDGRRLRPNIVIGGVEGLAERDWQGKTLHVGGDDGPVIRVHDLRDRCIMTTFDPDTQVQDVEVLKSIHARFEGKLALNCSVIQEGTLRQNDPVRLVDGG